VYVGIDPNCWCPMDLDKPPLAERPYMLAKWTKELDPALASSCLFGIYKDWIDLHTLREYMRMLEVDSRPETAARVAAANARSDPEGKVKTEATAMDTETDEVVGPTRMDDENEDPLLAAMK